MDGSASSFVNLRNKKKVQFHVYNFLKYNFKSLKHYCDKNELKLLVSKSETINGKCHYATP
jgi:hypothetical protein